MAELNYSQKKNVNMENIHQRLIRLREEKGYTIEEAALGLNVPLKALQGWENDVTPIYANTKTRSRFYEVSPFCIMTGFQKRS